MKENIEYIELNKKFKLYSILELILGLIICFIMFGSYAFFVGYLTEEKTFRFDALIIAITFTVAIFYLDRSERKCLKKKKGHYFFFKINTKTSFDYISNVLREDGGLQAFYEEVEARVYTLKNDDYFHAQKIRYIIFHMEEFNKDVYKKSLKSINRKYNRRYPESQCFSNPGGLYRVYILFIDKWSDDLEKKLNEYVNQMYKRVEKILFYVVYQNKLYVQPIYCDLVVFSYAANNKRVYRLLNQE